MFRCLCRPRLHFYLFPSSDGFFTSCFSPVPPLPVLGPSWRQGRAGQQFQPPVSLEWWQLPVAPGTVPWGAAEGCCTEDLENSRRTERSQREKLKGRSKSSEQGSAAGRQSLDIPSAVLSRRAALRGKKRPRERLWRWSCWNSSAQHSLSKYMDLHRERDNYICGLLFV